MHPSLAPLAVDEPQSHRTDPVPKRSVAPALLRGNAAVALPTPQRLIAIRRIHDACVRSPSTTVKTAATALGELLRAYDTLTDEVRRLRGPAQRFLLWDEAKRQLELTRCPLDSRLLDTLVGAARGESNAETSARLGLSGDAVKSRRKVIMRRLGARSMPNAVAISMAHGWIAAYDVLPAPNPDDAAEMAQTGGPA